MGMNYYAVRNRPTLESPIHIGKSSYGWLFVFQDQDSTFDESPIVWHTYEQVIDWLKTHTVGTQSDYVIMSEDEKVISLKEFIRVVQDKQKDYLCASNPDNFKYDRNVNGYRFTDREFC